ncbi:MAG: folylpolyglutamate synthase/dihydrofolate synthase [Ileibacterium sp.]|nr:folylpolyglutamate synthase/dihydrofolate synthase [Ileibacterium sp.]
MEKKIIEQEVAQMEARKGINHSIEQMRKWLDAYLPEHKNLKSVQIAGTNGKGSVCTWLNLIARENGWSTGVFTSPHLICHFERMQYNQASISSEEWHEIYTKWKDLFDREHFTMFEMDFWMALDWFLQKKPDLVIMETGLGGERDAVTAMDHQAKAITNIGLDHMAWLGDTREQIALTKGKIARKNVPVITAERDESCLAVLRQCALAAEAPFETGLRSFETWPAHLPVYQKDNLALALTLADHLGLSVTAKQLEEIQKAFSWKGRFEILDTHPLLVADGAHNIDGIRALVESCAGLEFKQIYFSVLKDKAGYEMIHELQKISSKIVLVDFENGRLADLETMARKERLPEVSFDQMMDHLENRKEKTLVCGSLYFVGELLAHWKGKNKNESCRV